MEVLQISKITVMLETIACGAMVKIEHNLEIIK